MKFMKLCFLPIIFMCTTSVFAIPLVGGISAGEKSAICKSVTLQKQDGTGGPDNLYIGASKTVNSQLTLMVYTDNKCAGSVVTSIATPTRDGYVFNGYYSLQTNGDLLVKPNGDITNKMTSSALSVIYAQWEKCIGTVENNVCKKNCETDLFYGNDCVRANAYLDNGEWKTCPEPKQGYKDRYSFVKEESSSYNIETCAIKLTTSLCGSRTKVIYKYNTTQNAYVRSDDYVVVGGNKSLAKAQTDHPSDTIYLADDNDNTHNSQSEDYCIACGRDKYNINGVCGYCHSGYYVDNSTDTCEICPAGFMCPGSGDREGENARVDDPTPCGRDEYAQTGQSQCLECGPGYSTYASGPAVRISEDVFFDGTCKSRDGDGTSAFGVICTSINACKLIPTQLCFKPNCQCTKEGYSETDNYIEQRTSCESSYDLGDNKVWGPINTAVVQTIPTKPKQQN